MKFATSKAHVQEYTLWMYEGKMQNYTTSSMMQRMFPSFAREAEIPSLMI